MQKLKIAFVSVARNPVPPKINTINGISTISAIIAEELQAKGHEVNFFCMKGSTVHTQRTETSLYSVTEFYGDQYYNALPDRVRTELQQPFNAELHLLLLENIAKNYYDIIQFHTYPTIFSLSFSRRITIPKVFTFHNQFSEPYNKILDIYAADKNNYFVSISLAQRKFISAIKYIGNIYHGIDTNFFNYNENDNNYIFYSGRFHPEKGLDMAISTAKKTNKKLIFTGQESSSGSAYYDKDIKPFIDNTLIINQKLDTQKELVKLYSEAKLFLLPIRYEESFGLVFAEAMSTGTPVIAFAKGSVPEIIKDGQTGFIVNPSDTDIRGDWIIKKTGIEGLCEAVERIYAMPADQYRQMRQDCRKHVEEKFTVERMVDEYEKVYQKIINST
ncbi:glycosyltransferase [Patescibacteria group bacterium]|nr:glycosyltransferase [Patescibacteria group bacterium]